MVMMNVDNFPYSIHDEPRNEWTIEELLQWCLLQSQHKTITKRDEIMNGFQELFDVGKQEILDLQLEVGRIQKEQDKEQQQQQEDGHLQQQRENNKGIIQNSSLENENQDPNKKVEQMSTATTSTKNNTKSSTERIQKTATTKSSSIKSSSTKPSSSTKKKPSIIQIQIIEGPHKNTTHNLKPTYKKPCWIGRSSSKKFCDRGISLNKDDEVSTTHGKFHIYPSGSKGKLFFTDTGSTNGTVYLEEEVEDNVPLELVDGMVLVVGVSHLLIHLI